MRRRPEQGLSVQTGGDQGVGAAQAWRGRRILALALAAASVAGLVWSLWGPPDLASRIDAETVDRLVAQAGVWGPAAIVGLMTLAVVMSPIPSAPSAMAAGAAYGQIWGTIQVIVGAELGALIAFGLARILGRDTLRRWFGDRIDAGLLGSQNALTVTVLLSRLMPFVSFDLISYAAGLSRLHLWRFALATLAGIIPASFLLAAAVAGLVYSGKLSPAAAVLMGAVAGAVATFVA